MRASLWCAEDTSHGREAAIDEEKRARHERGVGGREEQDAGSEGIVEATRLRRTHTDRRAVDMLDDGWVNAVDRLGVAQVGTVGSQLVANPGSEDESGAPNDFEAPDLLGGPSGTRTPDPLIKSQLLCQLS